MSSVFSPTHIGSLHATCPSQDSSRYDQRKGSRPKKLVIEPEITAPTVNLPPRWSMYIQPEGKVYFCHAGPMITITESWIYSPEKASQAEKWIQHITSEVKTRGRDLTNVELYIRTDENLDCSYYIVDKHSQALFWINDSLTTEVVGLPHVVSPSHLKTILEKEFWQHTDRFPAHFGGLQEESLLKLLDALAYIRVDQITSCYSTFIHSTAVTQAIHDVLERCRGRTHESEVVGTIARGWHAVLLNRFHNLYGQETPRIDSRHAVFDEPEGDTERHPFVTRVISFLTLGHSDHLHEEMNTLFVDQLVRSSQVSEFVQEQVQEWKFQVVPSLLMLLLHISFFFVIPFNALAATSAMLFSANLVTALTLIQRHNDLIHQKILMKFNQVNPGYRLRMTAFAFALPRAFFSWGLVFFFGHWFRLGITGISLPFAAALVGTVGIICYVFVFISAPAEGTRTDD